MISENNGAKAPLAIEDDSTISSITDDHGTSSVTSSDDATISAAAHRSYVARSYLQKNELVTEMQRLRIELRRKCDELDHTNAQHLLAVDDREDKIEDLTREIARLHQALNKNEQMANEQHRMQDDALKAELVTLMERVRALEELNLRLSEEQSVSKQHFKLIRLTQAEYSELKAAELNNELSLSELVSIRVHEELSETVGHLERLSEELRKLDEDHAGCRSKMDALTRQLEEKCIEADQLQWSNVRLEKRLAGLLGGPFAIRESCAVVEQPSCTIATVPAGVESDIGRLRAQLESVTNHLTSERERLVRELDSARDALRVAADEANVLRRQAIDSGQRSVFLEERLTALSSQLDTLKSGREEMLEKYLASKEEVRAEFNQRLIRELDELRSKNTAEYDRLRQQMKEVFEQEAVSLRSTRDVAVADKDKAVAAEAETKAKYERILVEFKGLEFSLESQTADMVSQLRVKTFELDRLRSVLDETDANLRSTKDSYEALRDKFDVLIRDHQGLATESQLERRRLEDELDTARQKLASFERSEADLDDLVMQAADAPMANEAERILVSYGAAAAVPASFRRRLEQSVRLARRVLELERVNKALRMDYDRKSADVTRLTEEVADLTNLISLSRHPDQKVIVEALKTRDEESRGLKSRNQALESQLQAAKHELVVLSKEKEEMAADLQTLLDHRDEISRIRQQLNLANPSGAPKSRDDLRGRQRTPAGRHNISPPVLLH